MKFLVLASFVCLAAASPQRFPTQSTYNTAAQTAGKAAAVIASPFVAAANAIVGASNYVAGKDATAQVVRSDYEVQPNGFNYNYEADNGIAAEAHGTLKNIDNAEVLVFQGGYKYVDSEGHPVNFQYIADENGYQPQSDVLPTPPPVPVAIQRALEYIAAHPYTEDKKY